MAPLTHEQLELATRRKIDRCSNVLCANRALEGTFEVVVICGLVIVLCSPCAADAARLANAKADS